MKNDDNSNTLTLFPSNSFSKLQMYCRTSTTQRNYPMSDNYQLWQEESAKVPQYFCLLTSARFYLLGWMLAGPRTRTLK